MSAVRRLAAGEAPALAAIVRSLPEYFTDDVPGKVEHDAASYQAWVITDDTTIAGFIIAERKSPGGGRSQRGDGQDPRQLGRLRPVRGHACLLRTQRLRLRRHDRPVARLGAR